MAKLGVGNHTLPLQFFSWAASAFSMSDWLQAFSMHSVDSVMNLSLWQRQW